MITDEYPLALADGVCHVAAVELVAVKTWPLVGAAAALTDTVVVALLSASAYPVVFWFRVGTSDT